MPSLNRKPSRQKRFRQEGKKHLGIAGWGWGGRKVKKRGTEPFRGKGRFLRNFDEETQGG